MGDINDGSSTAAQGALPQGQTKTTETKAPRKRGLWARLFGGADPVTPSSEPAPQTEGAVPRQSHGMINLRRMRVEDVAIPKAEIVAVPATITREDLVTVFRDSGMTRLPVFQDTLDTPVGLVHLKDFALRHGFNGKQARFSMKEMLRPLLFVPPSMPIGVLLQKMQTERRHMALVIDEYGGVDGLVTIEDLIEQVIGQIEDEHDVEEGKLWTREADDTYIALAKTPLKDFGAETGVDLTEDESVDEEEIDTLGGLVFMLSGRVPARGEIVPHPAGHEIEVVDADPRRIKRLRVRLRPTGAGPAGPTSKSTAEIAAQ
jgi:magnesium and cobalt transporter